MFSQSESVKELAGALVKFHAEVGKVKKDSTNPFFKNRYASLSNILDAIGEPLQQAGLAVVQMPEGEGQIATEVMHVSGEWMRCSFAMPVKEANNPQAVGSSVTYGRRYALAAALCLNIDEDDDGNAGSAGSPAVPVQRPAREHADFYPDAQPDLGAPVEITVKAVKEGETNGKPWRLAVTTADEKFFDPSSLLAEGGTYRVALKGKNVVSAEAA